MLLKSLAMQQANMNQLSLPLVILLLFFPPLWAFDGRLSLGAALDTSDKIMRNEFPASVGEQLHLTQFPLEIYGKTVEQIKVYANGFVVLGNHSLEVPPNYPSQTAYSKHRLNEMPGDFIAVFTTVNQCSPKGKIIIRELDVSEVESNTCVFDHVARIGSIIDNASPNGEDAPFLADYILTITWEDMGCVPSSSPLTNTFTMALVRMGDRVYAVFQYDHIQWTADHSTSSLPPEAGIFIHEVDTPQLPRNNMHIEPSIWNEESNIAVPGEWLFPLNEGPIDVDVAAQSKIRMHTEDFVVSSANKCANMVVRNPISTIPSFDSYSYTSPIEESSAATMIPSSYQTDTESPASTYLTGAPLPIVGSEDTSAPMYYTTETPYNHLFTNFESVATASDQRTTFSYQTTSVKTSYDDMYATPPSMNLQRCESSSCKDSISDCFIVDGQNCCVCPSDYYGGGQEGCHPIKPKEPRRIYFEGEMSINLPDRDSTNIPIFLDTEIRSGNSLLIQSGTHKSPRNFPTIHALSPIFNILNTFLALPKEQANDDRIFNVFSLTSGFTASFNFSFYVNVGRNGRLRIKGGLKHVNSDRDTYRGSLNIQVNSDGSFSSLNSPLVDSDGLIQSDNQRDRLIEFEKVGAGRVLFTPVTFNLISTSGEKIAVDISGDGEADLDGACLLAEGGLLKNGQKYAVNMGSQGYCREDCRPENDCSIYCIDMPVFTSSATGNSQVKLTPDPSVCQMELDPGPCDASILRYGFHSQKGRCIEFVYGGCHGNANNFESMSECEAKCGREDTGYLSSNSENHGEIEDKLDVYQQPIDPSLCASIISRYAFNPSTKSSFCALKIHVQTWTVVSMLTELVDVAIAMKIVSDNIVEPDLFVSKKIHTQVLFVAEVLIVATEIGSVEKDT
ncbi:unnamed protein product [Hymenolepis diminuta]|uniref:BPTI/Kunitz inhibitor domain-containing protein n=1 Tax=Hymenolepis diminuta TaxID=6216 RepID=A0A0R3S8R2_HYMDI|nr:unnamed protein product [Hymenolepis diminuta]